MIGYRGEAKMAEESNQTWEEKRAALRWRLAERAARWDHQGPLRTSRGAVVEPDRATVRIVARSAFLEVAGDVAPEMLRDLAGDPLDYFAAVWLANGGSADASPELTDDQFAVMRACMRHLVDAKLLAAWCDRWGFPMWIAPPAWVIKASVSEAMRYVANEAWGLMVASATVMTWRTWPCPNEHRLKLFDPLSLASEDVLGLPSINLERPLNLPPQRWDPLRETRAAANDRITRSVNTAIRAELRRIEAEALAVGEPAPIKRTGLEHLAWLARYQFRRESVAAIAVDVFKERQSVDEAIRAAADLVGLVLRNPSPPGRPRRQTPRVHARKSRPAPVRN